MQLHERTVPTQPHAHETRLLRGLRVQGPHIEAHRRPRGRGQLAPRLKRVSGRVQHRQVGALIEHHLSQLSVMETPREGSSAFRASPDARGRHETTRIATPPRLVQPLPPTLSESGVALSHALLALDGALPGGDGRALAFARPLRKFDDRLDDRGRNEGDDQNVVDVISDHLHPLTPPDQQKAPSSRELGASAPATGFEPVTVRLTVGCSAVELRRIATREDSSRDYSELASQIRA